jgi:hypothetical protein
MTLSSARSCGGVFEGAAQALGPVDLRQGGVRRGFAMPDHAPTPLILLRDAMPELKASLAGGAGPSPNGRPRLRVGRDRDELETSTAPVQNQVLARLHLGAKRSKVGR